MYAFLTSPIYATRNSTIVLSVNVCMYVCMYVNTYKLCTYIYVSGNRIPPEAGVRREQIYVKQRNHTVNTNQPSRTYILGLLRQPSKIN